MSGAYVDPDLAEAKNLLDLHERRPGESYQLLFGAVQAILRFLITREQREAQDD